VQRKHLTDTALLDLYLTYKTDVMIMTILKVSKATLWRYKKQLGVTKLRIKNARHACFMNLREMGHTIDEIAKKTGYSIYHVREVI
jgi:hypothetical protein